MKNIFNKFISILNSDLSFVRLFLVWMMFWMVIDFLLPYIKFNDSSYAVLKRLSTEDEFSIFCIINIGFTLFSLFYNEKINLLVYIMDAVLSCIIWNILNISLLYTYFFYNSDSFYPGIICAAITSWWVLIKYPWKLRNKEKTEKNDNIERNHR